MELKNYVLKIAVEIEPKFELTKDLQNLFGDLYDYFTGKPNGKLDQNKGIALVGVYGVGKTTTFRIFHEFLKRVCQFNPNLFVISSVEDLINEVNTSDWINKQLTYNIKISVTGGNIRNPRHILINEFGYQYNIKNYGTDVNELVEAWLMKRYDIFQEHRKLTHITSNFGIKDLQANFHPKIVDRFKEMFNFIELKGSSFRK